MKEYEKTVAKYKAAIHELLQDIHEALELREIGDNDSIYITTDSLQILKDVLEEKADQIDGRV